MAEAAPHHLELIYQFLVQGTHFWVHQLLVHGQTDSEDVNLRQEEKHDVIRKKRDAALQASVGSVTIDLKNDGHCVSTSSQSTKMGPKYPRHGRWHLVLTSAAARHQGAIKVFSVRAKVDHLCLSRPTPSHLLLHQIFELSDLLRVFRVAGDVLLIEERLETETKGMKVAVSNKEHTRMFSAAVAPSGPSMFLERRRSLSSLPSISLYVSSTAERACLASAGQR